MTKALWKAIMTSKFASKFSNYFINITNPLNLKPSIPKSKSLSGLLKLCEDHFSVLKIKEKDAK